MTTPPNTAPIPAACTPFTALLPLASAHLLDLEQQARLRTHLATCARCQAEMASQEHLDSTLRRVQAAHQQSMVPLVAHQIARMATDTAPTYRALARPVLSPARARTASHPGRLLRMAPYAAVAALIVLAFALFNLPGHARGPTVVGGGGGQINRDTQLVGISMLASGTGWAIGEDANDQTVLFHYTSGQWRAAASPSGLPALAVLHSIAMVSDSEGWAVGGTLATGSAGGTGGMTATPLVTGPAIGSTAGNTSVLLHDAGGQWSVAQPTFAADLTKVVLRTASDGWAVGISADQEGMLLHYDGATWRRVQSPAFEDVQLNGVSAVAANDVWLTGRLNDASSTILHFDGASWQRQGGLDLSEAALSSIQMVSATEGWAAGGYCTCGHTLDVPPRTLTGALILHYSGGTWSFQTSSHPDYFLGDFLFDIAMVSPSEGWAVGEGSSIVHYSLGSWSPQASPSRLAPGASQASPSLLSISMVSATQGWAVGDQGTLLRFDNGDWEAF